VVCNIPVACNRATADFIISSPLMSRRHQDWDPASGQARRNQAVLTVARAG
jgi:methylglyoxal synthase